MSHYNKPVSCYAILKDLGHLRNDGLFEGKDLHVPCVILPDSMASACYAVAREAGLYQIRKHNCQIELKLFKSYFGVGAVKYGCRPLSTSRIEQEWPYNITVELQPSVQGTHGSVVARAQKY